jgi:hypothetical protein
MRWELEHNFYEFVEMLYCNNRSAHYIKMSNNLSLIEFANKCEIRMHYLDMVVVFFIHRSIFMTWYNYFSF